MKDKKRGVILDLTDQETRERFLALIPEGMENAISCESLATSTGLTERGVRDAVFRLKVSYGICVYSNEHGYYFPADGSEARASFKLHSARVHSANQALSVMEMDLKRRGYDGEVYDGDTV